MVPCQWERLRETYNYIKGLYKQWMRIDSRTKEQIGETIVLEQYFRVQPPKIHIWVKEDNPQTREVAACLAECYKAPQRDPLKTKVTVGKPRFGDGKPHSLPPMDSTDAGVSKKPVHSDLKPNIGCYHCRQPGHKASMCPLRKSKSVELCSVPHVEIDDLVEVNDNGLIPHKHVGKCHSYWS